MMSAVIFSYCEYLWECFQHKTAEQIAVSKSLSQGTQF